MKTANGRLTLSQISSSWSTVLVLESKVSLLFLPIIFVFSEDCDGECDPRYLSVSATCWEVAPKQVDLQHTLGSGSFGEVWKAVVSGLKGVAGETTVAVKKLKRKSFQNRMFFY